MAHQAERDILFYRSWPSSSGRRLTHRNQPFSTPGHETRLTTHSPARTTSRFNGISKDEPTDELLKRILLLPNGIIYSIEFCGNYKRPGTCGRRSKKEQNVDTFGRNGTYTSHSISRRLTELSASIAGSSGVDCHQTLTKHTPAIVYNYRSRCL